MRKLVAAALLPFSLILLAPLALSQQPAAGANAEHRIAFHPQPVHINWSHAPAVPVAAQASASATYMYCASDIGTSPVYFSDVFSVAVPPGQHSAHSPDQAVFNKVAADFHTFIRNKYAYKTSSYYPTGCPTFGEGSGTLSAAQDGKKKLEAQVRASNLAVIETGWTYGMTALAPAVATPPPPPPAATPHPAPPPAAPVTHPSTTAPAHPAAAAPAVVAPAGKAYRCAINIHQSTGPLRYVAGPIVTEAAQPALTEAWKNYFIATYHPSGKLQSAGCTILPGGPARWEKAVTAFEQNSSRLGVPTSHVNWTSAPKH